MSQNVLAILPPLADQLSYVERFLRAAQGTGVGVIANPSSFIDSALSAAGTHRFQDSQPNLEQLMDTLLENQERVMRVVCDRFAGDLALIVVNDDIADQDGLVLPADLFMIVFQHRMERLITPAKEHGSFC